LTTSDRSLGELVPGRKMDDILLTAGHDLTFTEKSRVAVKGRLVGTLCETL
jgi:hypothetical protein